MKYLRIIVSLIFIIITNSGCSAIAYIPLSPVQLYYELAPDPDLSSDETTWGQVRRGTAYRLKNYVFINNDSIDPDSFLIGRGLWPRKNYNEQKYPNVKTIKKGTKITFLRLRLRRNVISGNYLYTTGKVLDGEFAQHEFEMTSLCDQTYGLSPRLISINTEYLETGSDRK